jgi:hypothetical protein
MTGLEIATTVLLVGGILLLAVSVSFFFRTYLRVREMFPATFREGLAVTYLVDTYVWDPLVPSTVRRQYFLYLGCLAIASCLFTGLFILEQLSLPAVLFGAVSAVGVIATLIRWINYRDRL